MAEPAKHDAPSATPGEIPTPRQPQGSRWARLRRLGHPLGKAYPAWVAVGLIVILLVFAHIVGWMIRNEVLGF
jgi:hypothetical protein